MMRRRAEMMAAVNTVPTDFVWLVNFVGVGGTFTAPGDGYYRFYVIGAGGNGGNGGASDVSGVADGEATPPPVTCDLGQGGGAGASGAYALHQVFMRNAETAVITYSGGNAGVVVAGETISAPKGGDGTAGNGYRQSSASNGGAGASASGANLLNIKGANGGNGAGPTEKYRSSDFNDVSLGGTASLPSGVKYMGTAAGTGASIKLGGGADGGKSASITGTVQGNGWIRIDYGYVGTGGTGKGGGVVVERGV